MDNILTKIEMKRQELQKLNAELQKVEQYRLDLMSQILKVQGALETLQQLQSETSEVKESTTQ